MYNSSPLRSFMWTLYGEMVCLQPLSTEGTTSRSSSLVPYCWCCWLRSSSKRRCPDDGRPLSVPVQSSRQTASRGLSRAAGIPAWWAGFVELPSPVQATGSGGSASWRQWRGVWSTSQTRSLRTMWVLYLVYRLIFNITRGSARARARLSLSPLFSLSLCVRVIISCEQNIFKSYKRILVKFFGEVERGSWIKQLDFCGYPDSLCWIIYQDPDSGIFIVQDGW